MALVKFGNVSIGFGGNPLLDGVDFVLERGERACLIGRNGEGKTTFLKLVHGLLEPDSGQITLSPGVTTAYLPQAVPQELKGTVEAVVAEGARASQAHAHESRRPPRVERILSLVKLDGRARFEDLSGGQKRRALLARALVGEPDILLLDEPTNHLDIESIEWFERFLQRYSRTVLFVTHDRMFLRRLANRIFSLDRGRLSTWECDYDTFRRRQQEQLDEEQARRRRFEKKLSREEVWIRQGIKARRTRNEGRVRALEELREHRRQRRERLGTADLRLNDGALSGRLVVKTEDVSFSYTDRPLIQGLTTTIMRGDKVGILGPNGCGKTTLLRLLLGPWATQPVPAEETEDEHTGQTAVVDSRLFTFEHTTDSQGLLPTSGDIRHGTKLEVAYFDQHRQILDDQSTIFENIAQGSDTVTINGSPRHVFGYLQEFLFTPDRARCPVSVLSGGERNRLLLAKLFTRPANLLVMDEPTNDLDAETLELLEEQLAAYAGTLLLVSHDRSFLNNVVTSTLVFEGEGRVSEYPGGYDDWLKQRPAAPPPPSPEKRSRPQTKPRGAPRLSYMENRELANLPQSIEKLEAEQAELHRRMGKASFYADLGNEENQALMARSKALEQELTRAYERWEKLDSIQPR